MKKKIVVLTDGFQRTHINKINAVAAEYGYPVHYHVDLEEAIMDAVDAEILYGQSYPFIRAGKEARWICAMSAGVDSYLKPGVITHPDCLLSNSSGAYGLSIAEHLMMVTLMLLRSQPVYASHMQRHIWLQSLSMRSIKDSTILIVGTGDIGTNYAKRLRAFEPAGIIGINRSGKKPDPVYDLVEPQTRVDDYLPKADVVALCLPATPETRHFLSEKRIGLLSKKAYVINVGRGSAICQEALVKALNEERIAGAALDVMETEPIPAGDPLWKAKNCILTPHISGKMTLKFTVDKNVDMFCEDLVNYCEGRTLQYLVDREKGY